MWFFGKSEEKTGGGGQGQGILGRVLSFVGLGPAALAIPVSNLAEVRESCGKAVPVTWTKTEINAAAQAFIDWFDSAAARQAIGTAMDTATSPKIFTGAEKRAIITACLYQKFKIGA